MRLRALRGLFFAQQVLAAGVTSMCSPGDAGHIGVSVRDSLDAEQKSRTLVTERVRLLHEVERFFGLADEPPQRKAR